jgi:hypothetical protein
MAMLNIEK